MNHIKTIHLLLLFFFVVSPAQAAEEQYFQIAAGDVASGLFDQAGQIAGRMGSNRDCTAPRHCEPIIAAVQARPSARAALSNLRSGTVDAALAPSEQVYELVQGEDRRSWSGLRALARVSVQPLLILVRPDLPAITIAGLAGQRVVLGIRGTDRSQRAKAILRDLGLPSRSYREISAEGLDRMVAKVTAGSADAVVLLGEALDAATIALLAEGRLKLLTPGKAELDRALLSKPYLQAVHIRPTGGVAIASVATSAVLVVRSDLSAVEVTRVLNQLWGSSAPLSALAIDEETVSPAEAIANLPLPLHVSAEAYYRAHTPLSEEASHAHP